MTAAADRKAELKSASDDRVELAGVLDFESVPPLLEAGFDWLGEHRELEVDLAGVEHSNSAGLGLLIEWMRQARQRHSRLRFQNVPEGLLHIAQVCGVKDWLSPKGD